MSEDREPGNAADFSLSKTFKEFARIDLQNREVAALMGDVDPDSPGVLAGGINSRMGIPDKVRARILQKRNGQDFADLLFQILILESIARLDAMIAMHEEQMAEILEDIQAKNEALETLDREHEVIQGELEYYEEHGLFDLDDDGSLKNQEAEAIIAQWEADTGMSIDRSDPEAYGMILNVLKQIDDQLVGLREDINGLNSRYEWHKQQRNKAIEIKEQLSSGDPNIQELALAQENDLFVTYQAAAEGNRSSIDDGVNATEELVGISRSEAFRMNFTPIDTPEKPTMAVQAPAQLVVIK